MRIKETNKSKSSDDMSKGTRMISKFLPFWK